MDLLDDSSWELKCAGARAILRSKNIIQYDPKIAELISDLDQVTIYYRKPEGCLAMLLKGQLYYNDETFVISRSEFVSAMESEKAKVK